MASARRVHDVLLDVMIEQLRVLTGPLASGPRKVSRNGDQEHDYRVLQLNAAGRNQPIEKAQESAPPYA